jgi:hypothetical protein
MEPGKLNYKFKSFSKWSSISLVFLFGLLVLYGYFQSQRMYRSELSDGARSVHLSYKEKNIIVNLEYRIDTLGYKAFASPYEAWTDTIAKLFRVARYNPGIAPKYSQAVYRGLSSDSIPDFGEALIFQVLNTVSESDSVYFYGSPEAFIKWEIGKKGTIQSEIRGDSIRLTYWKKTEKPI